jgi:tetratricopeptide (TPR) repeat protein
LERYEEALEDFSRAIELDPTLAPAFSDRGSIFAHLGRHDEALADYRHAVQLDPTLRLPYFNIGAVLFNAGAWREAQPYFAKAAELGHPEAAQLAAEARWRSTEPPT